MPTLAGLYTSFSGRTLAIDESNRLTLLPKEGQPSSANKLRADGEFWLCCDDGVSNLTALTACFMLMILRR
ncbi:hypothetical protein ASPCADRAFT_209499 [Aspergillus carbonarius ITEM 5010]|uniref:Uncharacterized protein n=1 Tax=Aspergillus carbonarius (strain ITEM 5010) TaxID=602072 RepID=A0A1R3RGE7_ASPC5|nr:hypothetical protein ASPCADRAFT_209499 [Aspergillus carbonarius ITEM 5010]